MFQSDAFTVGERWDSRLVFLAWSKADVFPPPRGWLSASRPGASCIPGESSLRPGSPGVLATPHASVGGPHRRWASNLLEPPSHGCSPSWGQGCQAGGVLQAVVARASWKTTQPECRGDCQGPLSLQDSGLESQVLSPRHTPGSWDWSDGCPWL